MPTTTKINIYLGTGEVGLKREQSIESDMKRKGSKSMSEYIWQAIAHYIDCPKAKK